MTTLNEQLTLFTVLVGSRAHGMATPTSDVDHRSVVVLRTSELIKIGADEKHVRKRDGAVDLDFWELRRLLHLALKGDPNVLEALVAPLVATTADGDELRALFPKLLQRHKFNGACLAFARAQKYDLQEGSAKRPNKAGVHYLRTLYNGLKLLRTGMFTVNIGATDFGLFLMRVKLGEVPVEETLRVGLQLESEYPEALANSPVPAEADMKAINDFYLRVRRAHW